MIDIFQKVWRMLHFFYAIENYLNFLLHKTLRVNDEHLHKRERKEMDYERVLNVKGFSYQRV